MTGGWLLDHGFALAGSSYASTGWAIKEAPADQAAVLDAFEARVGRPRQTIAWGDSLGGMVTAGLVQRIPERLDGALPGCGVVAGAVATWNQALDAAFAFKVLVAPDLDRAKRFYGELFGWTAEDVPGPIPRTSFSLGELLVGGGHAPGPQEPPTPRWTVSFMVADADQTAAEAERLGGRVLLPTMDIPIGRFAVVADPAGGEFTAAHVPAGALRGVDGS